MRGTWMKFFTSEFSGTVKGCVMMMYSRSGKSENANSTNYRLRDSYISSMQNRFITIALAAFTGTYGSYPAAKQSTRLYHPQKSYCRALAANHLSRYSTYFAYTSLASASSLLLLT